MKPLTLVNVRPLIRWNHPKLDSSPNSKENSLPKDTRLQSCLSTISLTYAMPPWWHYCHHQKQLMPKLPLKDLHHTTAFASSNTIQTMAVLQTTHSNNNLSNIDTQFPTAASMSNSRMELSNNHRDITEAARIMWLHAKARWSGAVSLSLWS